MNFLLTLILSAAFARTPLYEAKTPEPPAVKNESIRKSPAHPNWNHVVRGNPITLPSREVLVNLRGLKSGEIVLAEVEMSLLAFMDSASPVLARAIDGMGRELVFLGEARLEKNSKRIFIEFKKVRLKSATDLFEFKGHALDIDGVQGVLGRYVSGETGILTAEFLASAAAGFTDASINRTTNVLGNQVEEVSLDSKTKKAAASALSKTAERLAEKARQAPAYSQLSGPMTIQILIESEPTRKL